MIVKIGFSKPLAIIIHIMALLPILGYSAFHLLFENSLIGALLFFTGVVLTFSLVAIIKDIDNDPYLQAFVICMTLTLAATCYYLGIRGALFVFPLLTSYFYSFTFGYALALSSLAAFSCMIALLNSLDPVTVARLSLGVSLTVFFNASFAYLVNKQKSALKVEANTDYLTGISNRQSFNSWLDEEIPKSLRKHRFLALLYVDLNDFKRVNDNYGHAVGDKVLIQASERLLKCIQANSSLNQGKEIKIARLAGDEFTLVLTHVEKEEEIESFVQNILHELSQSYSVENLVIHIGVSIGIALSGQHGNCAEELLINADAAMYRAKKAGKKGYQFFNSDIYQEMFISKEIERGIQNALNNNNFYIVFMPIYQTNTLDMVGVETLIRCDSPRLKDYGPDKFIPIAERCGLIYDIDLFVIEATFKKIVELKELNPDMDLLFCINLSAKELQNKEIGESIRYLLKKYNITPSSIEFEITETSLVASSEENINILSQLKELGVRLSLDDFGTGYTAFSQLADFPVDTLKIDRSFVAKLNQQGNEKLSMVNVITMLANLYELDIVAEGVETEEQLNYLKAIGCHYVQGYYLSHPHTWDALITSTAAKISTEAHPHS
ncbi:bifunctional diguanylate cyclase/phosphodiesterase [Pleionea sp. CnH1-48]|uniref:putative bifunctional diguanylate cyclase/phosphodiesterase n=1 Tax=Pleionea sp. CnH1-48 TaxID=2954494 RepID=UPI002096E5CE|nr:EAL domain-containing protein [Pleionea sp. CnH1-48]MCO7224885.1 EAL domain-containing protein [Pleionea sp. CnH1-48]